MGDKQGRPFRKGTGCQQCHDTGYRGRVGVYEVMEVTAEQRKLIHRRAPAHELRNEFRRSGGLTLREEGILIALEGNSSVEEVLSVTHTEDVLTDAAPTAPKGVAA